MIAKDIMINRRMILLIKYLPFSDEFFITKFKKMKMINTQISVKIIFIAYNKSENHQWREL